MTFSICDFGLGFCLGGLMFFIGGIEFGRMVWGSRLTRIKVFKDSLGNK